MKQIPHLKLPGHFHYLHTGKGQIQHFAADSEESFSIVLSEQQC